MTTTSTAQAPLSNSLTTKHFLCRDKISVITGSTLVFASACCVSTAALIAKITGALFLTTLCAFPPNLLAAAGACLIVGIALIIIRTRKNSKEQNPSPQESDPFTDSSGRTLPRVPEPQSSLPNIAPQGNGAAELLRTVQQRNTCAQMWQCPPPPPLTTEQIIKITHTIDAQQSKDRQLIETNEDSIRATIQTQWEKIKNAMTQESNSTDAQQSQQRQVIETDEGSTRAAIKNQRETITVEKEAKQIFAYFLQRNLTSPNVEPALSQKQPSTTHNAPPPSPKKTDTHDVRVTANSAELMKVTTVNLWRFF